MILFLMGANSESGLKGWTVLGVVTEENSPVICMVEHFLGSQKSEPFILLYFDLYNPRFKTVSVQK